MGAWDVKREVVVGFGVEVREGAVEEGVEEAMGKGGDARYGVSESFAVLLSRVKRLSDISSGEV